MGFDSTWILGRLDGGYATMIKILRILLIYEGVIVGLGMGGILEESQNSSHFVFD